MRLSRVTGTGWKSWMRMARMLRGANVGMTTSGIHLPCRDTCQIRLQVLSPETPEESGHLRETTLGYPRNRGIMDGGL